jgi:hypothetical protein
VIPRKIILCFGMPSTRGLEPSSVKAINGAHVWLCENEMAIRAPMSHFEIGGDKRSGC